MDNREIDPSRLGPVPNNRTIDPQVKKGIEQARDKPGVWVVAKGPCKSASAAVFAHQARNGKKWASVTKRDPLFRFRVWTDPDNGGVYVLVCYGLDTPEEPEPSA